MPKKSVTIFLILAILGLIFSTDSILYVLDIPTYSEIITGLLRNTDDTINWTSMTVFVSSVVILCVHWIKGNKK